MQLLANARGAQLGGAAVDDANFNFIIIFMIIIVLITFILRLNIFFFFAVANKMFVILKIIHKIETQFVWFVCVLLNILMFITDQ